MYKIMPTIQEDQNGNLAGEQVAESLSEPLISGPAPALWTGVAAVLIIFVLVMMMIIRGRVVRPAQRKAAGRSTYFEPAGEDADIDFNDDFAAHATDTETDNLHDDPHELDQPLNVVDAEIIDEVAPDEPTPAKKKSPFATLFGKKSKAVHLEPSLEDPIAEPANDQIIDTIVEPVPERAHAPLLKAMDDDIEHRRRLEEERDRERQLQEDAARRRHAELEADRQRRAEEERLHAQEELRKREDALRQEEQKREFELKQREEEAAARSGQDQKLSALESELNVASHTLRADLDRLQDSLGASLDQRFAAFSHELQSRLVNNPGSAPGTMEAPAISEAYFGEFADLMGEQITTLRDSLAASFDRLEKKLDDARSGTGDNTVVGAKIDRLNALLSGRFTSSAATPVQLADILRDALPANRFTLRSKLSNDRTADALVTIPGGQGAIAIDARFPMEAFEQYRKARLEESGQVASDTDFRRIALRHIVDVAERLIVPGETADSAIMFIPSETAFAELHADFPDLIQESYRARIWLTAPTALMATLHTISAVIGDAPSGASQTSPVQTDAFFDALYSLRSRVEALENRPDDTQGFDHPTDDYRADDDLLRSMSQDASALSIVGPREGHGDLHQEENDVTDTSGASSSAQQRPLFPLR